VRRQGHELILPGLDLQVHAKDRARPDSSSTVRTPTSSFKGHQKPMKILRAIGLTLLFLLTTLSSSGAAEADLRAIIAKFATVTDFSETGTVVQELTATDDPAVERPLAALADGNLYIRTADSMVFVGKEGDENIQLFDPLSGEAAGEASEDDITKISVNNTLRRAIRDALGTLTLGSKDPAVRIAAADTMFKTPDATNIEPLDTAIANESVASVKALLEQAGERGADHLLNDEGGIGAEHHHLAMRHVDDAHDAEGDG